MIPAAENKTSHPAWSGANGPAHWPTILILWVGISISCGVLWLLRSSEQTRAAATFTAAAREHHMVVQKELTDILQGLHAVSALFSSSEVVTRQEFSSFARTIMDSQPAIGTFAWVPVVKAPQRNEFEKAAAIASETPFQITELTPDHRTRRALAREEYFPALYVEPPQDQRVSIGLDQATLPVHRHAMRAAAASGRPIAKGELTASATNGSDEEAFNVVIFAPHYAEGADQASASSRRAALKGFVAVTFLTNVALQSPSVVTAGEGMTLELRVDDVNSRTVIRSGPTTRDMNRALQYHSTLELPGLRFLATSYATSAFAGVPHALPAWIAFLSGLTITLLAAWHFRSLRLRLWTHDQFQTERDRLFQLSPDLLCVCGFDGVMRELSPEWERTLGHSRAELLSRPFFDFVHPDDVPATRERLAHLQAGLHVTDFTNRYRHQDGTWRWLQWRCIPVPERALIYAVARDISQQLEIDRELHEMRRFNDRLAGVVPCVLYIYDLRLKRAVYVNQYATQTLGWAPDAVQHRTSDFSKIVHPEDIPRLLAYHERIKSLGRGELSEFTYRIRGPDGEWRWFHSRDAVFERDAHGHVKRSIGAATDITDIKIAEEALRENNRRLDFVLSAAKMAVWELDLETNSAAWTELFVRVLGLPAEQAPQSLEALLTCVHDEDRQRVRHQFDQALADCSLFESEFRLHLPDGRLQWIGTIGRFLCDEVGRPQRLFGLGWNATARKVAEAQRIRFEEQQRQSQKMEALGTLAGGIAHDFNNILTAVGGNARLALQELPAIHPIRTSLEEIQRGTARATDLVRRILAFSRDEEAVLRPVEIKAVVEDAIRLLRPIVPAMIDIRFEAAADLPAVLADATQIHQVIMNLGTNARDAMSERGGVLSIQLRQVQLDAQLKRLAPDVKANTCICMSVSDTGQGMSSQVLERIFDPFFTTKGPGRGTGMGLAMVHGIVRRHGGNILASSQPGRGARFDVYLPALVSPAQPQAPAVNTPQIAGAGERIMYVDDEEPLVYLAVRMLTKLGYDVEGRTDPTQALRDFSNDPLGFDMVITDLGMPGMSGIELAAQLLKIRPDLLVLITSGYVRPEDLARARDIGIDDIVLKPNTVEQMVHIFASRLKASHAMVSADGS